jgi:hypothetical protein
VDQTASIRQTERRGGKLILAGLAQGVEARVVGREGAGQEKSARGEGAHDSQGKHPYLIRVEEVKKRERGHERVAAARQGMTPDVGEYGASGGLGERPVQLDVFGWIGFDGVDGVSLLEEAEAPAPPAPRSRHGPAIGPRRAGHPEVRNEGA